MVGIKAMVIGMREVCEISIKGGDGSDGKECRLIPPRILTATDSGLPFQNPPVQIESRGLTHAGQALEPAARTLLDGVAVFLEIDAFGWSGGDVGECVEDGVGVGAEFFLVAGEACGEVR